jgi:hypothetical protein
MWGWELREFTGKNFRSQNVFSLAVFWSEKATAAGLILEKPHDVRDRVVDLVRRWSEGPHTQPVDESPSTNLRFQKSGSSNAVPLTAILWVLRPRQKQCRATRRSTLLFDSCPPLGLWESVLGSNFVA